MSAPTRPKKNEAPKLRQQPGPQSRAKGLSKASRRHSRRDSADSRSVVVELQREADIQGRGAAPHHALTSSQRRKLREIARRPVGDETKVCAALSEVGSLTAFDLGRDLQISVPHARLSELRQAGVPIVPAGWVRQPWGFGRVRTLKLYTLGVADGGG